VTVAPPAVSVFGIYVGDVWRAALEHAINRELSPHAQFMANVTPAGVWIVAFDEYREGASVTLHSAGARGALTRRFIRAVARRIWDELDVRRVNGIVRADNADALETNKRLGFIVEGVQREGYVGPDGVHDIVLMGMLRSECRWLPGVA
jgi:hypothetical protein